MLSHLSKAAIRLAVNTSPEPVTNLGASVAGDVGVVGVTTLAVLFPVAAAVIAGILLILMIWLALAPMSRIRRGWRWLRQRFAAG